MQHSCWLTLLFKKRIDHGGNMLILDLKFNIKLMDGTKILFGTRI